MSAEFTSIHFSTEATPPRHRLAIWREVIGHTVLRLDIEPLRDIPFEADVTLHNVPGLAMLSGVISGSRSGRTPALLADGVDDIGLVVNLAGPYLVSQRGRELTLGDGEATLFSCAETNAFMHAPPGRVLAMRVPRRALAAAKAEERFMRPIPATTHALRLLCNYVSMVRDELAAATPETRQLLVTHIHDLLMLTVGATGEAAQLAQRRGLRAGRLRAFKADIAANLGNHDLSVADVAARQGVSPRYVQMLFEAEGTTFSGFVLEQRLDRARHMLLDPLLAEHAVSAIAFAAGFGDLSYFNRAFRRRFGTTPSQLRVEGA